MSSWYEGMATGHGLKKMDSEGNTQSTCSDHPESDGQNSTHSKLFNASSKSSKIRSFTSGL